MNQRTQLGYPGFDVFSGVPGTGQVRIVRERRIGATPVAGPTPILHVSRFQLQIVIIGDAAFLGETVGMAVVLPEMHLSDVEVHELAFSRK
jgi:hypothetical protein